jgi:hypothetical protein
MATFREIATDALRYWERRRLVYNGVLAVIVIAVFLVALPESRKALTARGFGDLLILAVVANLLYCAAYIPDVFVQFSDFRDGWRKKRWMLFAAGTLLASALAFAYVSFTMFAVVIGQD